MDRISTTIGCRRHLRCAFYSTPKLVPELMSVFRDIRNVQAATTPRFTLVSAATRFSESQPSSKPLHTIYEFEIESSVKIEMAGKPPRDPLDWFGILIPSALSTAQASFKSAMSEAVSNLINVSAEMRELEGEVEGLRHRIRSTD